MTRPDPPAAAAPHLGGTVVATALLVTAGAGAWSRLLSGSLVRVGPLTAVAAVIGVTAALAAGRLSGRLAAGLLLVWLPTGLLAGGAPASQLLPDAWPTPVVRLSEGFQQLTTSHSRPIADQSWQLAGWLLGAGAVWAAGAALAASKPWSTPRRATAFGVLAVPWITAVLLGTTGTRQPDQAAAWQGATILLAGLLWFTAPRVAPRRAVALGLAAALVSVGTTQAVGPHTRWFAPASPSAGAFQTLQTEPTYGPLQGHRSGATMLEVTATRPALWRMRVLTLFFGPGWRIGYPPGELSQPAAQPVEVKVKVHGLRDDLVVTPGQINVVHGNGTARQAPGEAWQLVPPPRRGDTYQVRASVVHATAGQLQDAPAPTDPRLQFYTSLTPSYDGQRVAVPLFGQPPDPKVSAALDQTPYGPVAALARRLAAGARTQWDVVARVHRYLLDGDRFRYTTNLPEPGLFPLVAFLLGGRAGDCQHFAGAAALLLRLAGVPTRVVSGFATGARQRDGRFEVRDVDAHSWIEVYFQGYGWVAFNPTPAAAKADIPRRLDPLAPAAPGGGHHVRGEPGGLAADALLVLLAIAGVAIVGGRRLGRRAELGQLLEALVRRTGGHVQSSSTLAELGVELARLVGPQTAALATQAERARFAPHPPTPATRPRIRIARALTGDLGLMRALTVLVAPAATRRLRNRRLRTCYASAKAATRREGQRERHPQIADRRFLSDDDARPPRTSTSGITQGWRPASLAAARRQCSDGHRCRRRDGRPQPRA
jgi:protein-glutamine gamma-glutamyltransferase